MANKPPDIRLAGIRASIPPGYLLGRVSAGIGGVELISVGKAQSAGLIPSTLPGPPTGAAGGDLSGTYPNPTVAQLQGVAVAAGLPSNLAVLLYHTAGATWLPVVLAAVAYTNAYSDLSGLPTIHSVIAGGTAGQVLTKNSGTDYDLTWTTPSSGGGSSGAASVQDDGTNLYIAMSDTDGQLVLDGGGDPILSKEVLPPTSLPAATNAVQGAVLPDNVTLAIASSMLGTKFCGFSANLASNQNVSNNVSTTVVYDTVVVDTLSAYSVSTGIFTPTKAGNWLVFWAMRGQVVTSMTLVQGILQKNGATSLQLINAGQLGSALPNFSSSIFAFTVVSMNGSTDNIRVKGSVNGTGGGNFFDGTGILNAFGAIYLGP